MVPVVLVNGLEMPLAYLALMKLGAAFVPFDPAWPEERIAATLDVLAPKLVRLHRPGRAPARAPRARAAGRARRAGAARGAAARVALGPDDPIYGIFTSGTTGTAQVRAEPARRAGQPASPS